MKRALVLDDIREVADSICQMLSLLDFQAKAAYSPLAALLMVQEQVPDVIFVDIHMPGLEGVEVISFLKRELVYKDVPIIVVTSDDQKTTHEEALRAGALMVILKPVTIEMLEKAVKAIE